MIAPVHLYMLADLYAQICLCSYVCFLIWKFCPEHEYLNILELVTGEMYSVHTQLTKVCLPLSMNSTYSSTSPSFLTSFFFWSKSCGRSLGFFLPALLANLRVCYLLIEYMHTVALINSNAFSHFSLCGKLRLAY